MLRKVLLIVTFCLLSNFAFADGVAVRDATVDKRGWLLFTTVSDARYIVLNLEDIKVLVDRKLDGTYVNMAVMISADGKRVITYDGDAKRDVVVVRHVIVYVRSTRIADRWNFALSQAKFPQDVVPTVK